MIYDEKQRSRFKKMGSLASWILMNSRRDIHHGALGDEKT